ncbi:glycoside hydrolase family 43 protein [Catenovulum adriaticum]|uniref:Glycoside hydrolase family 43 protein n=1 Tax=Catenovulum adriaticum TaxID=2984846 RepID=A0ABY7ASS5_9ALTE|nr:glycoside hydrolase family 43 protein [Catenovulum sp. TS8]WAJ71832.1 glycoside hydrolase family 43 protein [Catenovulum sp. TS8]
MSFKQALCLISGLITAQLAYAQPVTLADPTVWLEGDKYYMLGTEAPPQQGFPVFESDNLKSWKSVSGAKPGYALFKGEQTFGERGFWAPQVFKHNHQYFLAYTANERIAIAQSNSAKGPFTRPQLGAFEPDKRQIDPFVFFDDDGKVYLFHVRLNKGNHIYVAEMKSDLSSIKANTLTHCLSPQKKTWEMSGVFKNRIPTVAEGPTVIKHKDNYYLLYSANHFMADEYAVGYATAKSPMGPWTRYQGNPILSQANIGLDGTGHGDVFTGKDNKIYYVFHAHANENQVHPRKTMIVELEFVAADDGIDQLRVKPSSLIQTEIAN